ncbi:MAG: 2,3-bisphosphoglycerate-dependent phosphoglycerate mutase [Candidatus Saccharimonadales bacterium]
MTKIIFYDTSGVDKEQLSMGLTGTNCQLQFIKSAICIDNLDPETEILSVFVSSNVTRSIIEKLPKLRLIACRSTGFNNIDVDAADDHNVVVVNVPSYGEQTVAEYAFSLLLALSRKLPESIAGNERQRLSVEQLRGFDLSDKTIGVIGTGHIGLKVAQIARGFDMHVIAYDPYPNAKAAKDYGIQYVSLEKLLWESDVVTLHVPYMKDTHHLLNRDRLASMKPSAIIINTARGELIDTEALIIALHHKTIAGAGLDVLEGEGLWHLDDNVTILEKHSETHIDAQHSLEQLALSKLHNVIITPHNAFNTTEAIGRINSMTCSNIIKFCSGKTENIVKNPPRGRGKLILIRHAESEWNIVGRWTGTTDVHLSDKGFRQAVDYGQLLMKTGLTVDFAYCSELVRTQETLQVMLDTAQQLGVPYEHASELNERDYGVYTGKNKWEVKEQVGEEEFQALRRGWDHHVPSGETLKMVYERVVPFYQQTVFSHLDNGENVLIVAHGNSLRALIKYLEQLSDDTVSDLEIPFGALMIYDIDNGGYRVRKEVQSQDMTLSNVQSKDFVRH